MTACKGGKDDATDTDDADVVDTDVAVTLESFCAQLSDAICDGYVSCDCRFDVRPYTADTCVAARAAECEAFVSSALKPDLDAGRAVLDADHIRRCVAGVRAMADTCSVSWTGGLPDACAASFSDAAAIGEACVAQGNAAAFCANGAGICTYSESGPVCVARPVEGEACPEGACGEDLRCAPMRGECVKPGAADAPCAESAECADGLVCSAAGACAAPIAVGGVCDADAQCAEGLVCDESGTCADAVPLGGGCYDPSECGAARSCGRAPETRTCGEADGLDDACRDGTCADGLACASGSQTCVSLPNEDETCLDGFGCADGLTCADGLGVCAVLPGQDETCASGARFCDDGLGCDFQTNTCQPGPGEGEECLINPPDYLCAEGLGCDFGALGSVCVPIQGAGSACNTDRTCSADTFCDFSTLKCTDRYADGASCSSGNECGVGSSCTPLPQGYVCAPIPARGESCVDVCDEGSVCKGPGGQCVTRFCVIP
jgi:hypothetical protein